MNEKNTLPCASPLKAAAAQAPGMPHSIVIENRHTLTATGIGAILSYDSFTAALATDLGTLTVGGEGLTVSELSVHTGEVKISGSIEYVQYTAKKDKRESLLHRLVR